MKIVAYPTIIVFLIMGVSATLFAAQDPMEYWMEIYAESGNIINHRKSEIDPLVALTLYEKIVNEVPPAEIVPEVELLKAQLLYSGDKRNRGIFNH